MKSFTVHSRHTAPKKSIEQLQRAEKAFGFVPNLIGVLAESPAATEAYLHLNEIFDTTSFSAAERQVVLLTVSRQAECEYCMAAHSTVAEMQKVPAAVIAAVRNDEAIAVYKLEALRAFTAAVVKKRGWVSDADLNGFFDAGYGKRQVLEVILGVAVKTLSNYANHISDTPVDSVFAAKRWKRPGQ